MRTVVTPVNHDPLTALERARIASEIVATYCVARWWLVRLSFTEAVAAARDVPSRSPTGLSDAEVRSTGLRLGAAGQRTPPVLPGDLPGLVTALVLTRSLARPGVEH